MRFALTADQCDLRDLVRSVLERECPPALLRAEPGGAAHATLGKHLAAIGAPGLLLAERSGGLGLDEVALVVLLTEAGWAGVPLPLLEVVTWAAPLLHDHRPDLLAPLLAGDATVAVDASGGGVYTHGRTARWVLSGGWAGAGPVALCPVDEVEPVASVDPSRGLVRASLGAGAPVADGPAVLLAWRRAVLGVAAELVGLARRMLEMSVGHVRERRQFGVPVGSFQAVAHPLADAHVLIEFAEPVVWRAAHSMSTGAATAGRDVAMAKAMASSAASRVARVALQAHGAIGYTAEHDLALFLKRTWALVEAWGSAGLHRREVAASLGLPMA